MSPNASDQSEPAKNAPFSRHCRRLDPSVIKKLQQMIPAKQDTNDSKTGRMDATPAPSVGEMARWLRRQASFDSDDDESVDYSSYMSPNGRSLYQTPLRIRQDSGIDTVGRDGSTARKARVVSRFFDSVPDLSALGVHKDALEFASQVDEGEDWGSEEVEEYLRLGPNQHVRVAETEDIHGVRQSVTVVLENVSDGPKDDDDDQCQDQNFVFQQRDIVDDGPPEGLINRPLYRYPSFVFIKDKDTASGGKLIKIVGMVKNLAQKARANTLRRDRSGASAPNYIQPDQFPHLKHRDREELASNTGLPVGVVHPDVLAGSGSREEQMMKQQLRRADYLREQQEQARRQVVGTLNNGTTLTLFINAGKEQPEQQMVSPKEETQPLQPTRSMLISRPLPPLPAEAYNFNPEKKFRRKPVPGRRGRFRDTTIPAAPDQTPHRAGLEAQAESNDDDTPVPDILQIRGLDSLLTPTPQHRWRDSRRYDYAKPTEDILQDDAPTPKSFHDPRYSEATNDEVNRLNDLARLRRLAESEEYPVMIDTFAHDNHVSVWITEQMDQDTTQSHYGRMSRHDSDQRQDRVDSLWQRLEEESSGAIRNPPRLPVPARRPVRKSSLRDRGRSSTAGRPGDRDEIIMAIERSILAEQRQSSTTGEIGIGIERNLYASGDLLSSTVYSQPEEHD